MNFSIGSDLLLEASLRAVVIAGLIATVLAAFRVGPAATRHASWAAVMMVMVLMPVVSRWVPTIAVPAWVPQFSAAAVVPAVPRTVAAEESRLGEQIPQKAMAVTSASAPGPAPSPNLVEQMAPAKSSIERLDWRQWMVVVWLAIAIVMLLRELIGGLRVRRLAAEGTPSSVGDGTYESCRVMSPVVTGVWRPRVMVPASWSEWAPEVRQLVLAHEHAHLHRHDPLIAAFARLNRAVFWFHPLAWWMERHLSRLAERACDEAVVRQWNDPRGYAALLVEMALQVRRQGYRVAWQGIGIVSASRFEDRLDRILRGPSPERSRKSNFVLATTCGLLLMAGLACRSQAPPLADAPPLAEDPAVAKDIADRAAAVAEYESVVKMTLDDVAQLEAVVAKNPDDLVATEKLLTFYFQRGQKLMGWDRMLTARRALTLRMIASHPESRLTYWPYSREADPVGYQKARLLWMDRLERDVTLEMLSNAAHFFERSDKPMAEQVLLRAQTSDPKGPTPRVVNGRYNAPWSTRLGELYAMAIVGSDGLSSVQRLKSVNAEQAKGPFAKLARQKLDQSNDSKLLIGAAGYLTRLGAGPKLDFDQTALGLSYAEKARKLDPSSAAARQILSTAAHNADWDKQMKQFGQPAHTLDASAFKALPEADKLAYAIDFLYAFRLGQHPDTSDATFESLKDRAEALQYVLDKADASAIPPGLQANIHLAFGTYAMHRGNRREAVRRLGLAGSTAPAAPSIGSSRLFDYSGTTKLAYDLLDAGERESVAVFYDAVARSFEGPDRTRYEDAAKAIRAGRMPADYQRYLARSKGFQ